jgi:hypothetical protein
MKGFAGRWRSMNRKKGGMEERKLREMAGLAKTPYAKEG